MLSDHRRTEDTIGALVNRLRIEVPTDTPKPGGGSARGWATYCDRRGRIAQAGERFNEGLDGGALVPLDRLSVRLKADSLTKAITSKMRVRDRDSGAVYGIETPHVEALGDWVVLSCKRGAA